LRPQLNGNTLGTSVVHPERIIGPDRRWLQRGSWIAAALVPVSAAASLYAGSILFLFVPVLIGSSVYGFRSLRSGAFFLKLTPTGLTWRTPTEARTLSWYDVDFFRCQRLQDRERVIARLVAGDVSRKDFSSDHTRQDIVLPDPFELAPGELARTLEEWRRQHVLSRDGHDERTAQLPVAADEAPRLARRLAAEP
jgi:hypothetical protein